MTRSPAVTAAIDQLKPCPFCGEAEHLELTSCHGDLWVICHGCEASTKMHNSKEAASEAWNTRPEAQPSPEAQQTLNEIFAATHQGADYPNYAHDYLDSDKVLTILTRYAAAVRAQALEEAAQAMSPMLRDMISRGKAVELIRALHPTQGGE